MGNQQNKFIVKRVCDSEIKSMEWWIEGLVPKEAFCLLAGEGGAGKSSFIVYLAERLANMGLTVLLITSEGNGGMAYHKRMSDTNAKLDNLLWLDLNGEANVNFALPTIKDIAEIVDSNGVDVLFLDPITMFATGDTNKGQQVRSLLTPFDRLSTSKKITIFGLAHFNKPEKHAKKVKYCITGSAEWTNVPRLVYCLGKKDERLGYVVLAKANDTKDERAWAVEYEPTELSRRATNVFECDYGTADEALSNKTSVYDADKNTPPDIMLKIADKFKFKPFTIADIERMGLSGRTFRLYKDSKWVLKDGTKMGEGKGRPQERFVLSGLLTEQVSKEH